MSQQFLAAGALKFEDAPSRRAAHRPLMRVVSRRLEDRGSIAVGHKDDLLTAANPPVAVEPQELPAWAQVATRRLGLVLRLEPGWAGPKSRTVERPLIQTAFKVIQDLTPEGHPEYVPHVVPLVDGGLLLELHRDGFDLEVDISRQGEMDIDFERPSRDTELSGAYHDLRDEVAKELLRASQGL